MSKTILLHALRKGSTEDWQAELITAKPDTVFGRGEVKKARAWAESKGFHHFTESRIVDGALPDFAGTVNI